MELKTIEVFRFDELDEDIQEKVLNEHREINIDYDWYEFSLEDIAEQIKAETKINIDSKDIFFNFAKTSGLWIERDNIIKSFSEKYPELNNIDISEDFGCWFYMGRCRDTEVGEVEFDEVEEDEEVKQAVKENLNKKNEEKVRDDLYKLLEILEKGFKQLSEEYDYKLSDKGIKETIEINEYKFDEDGEMV